MSSNSHMKAIIFRKVGGPEVLELANVAKPTAQHGEALVRVHASALNRIDYYLRIEDDDAMPMPHILGSDVAGSIDSLGSGVTGWQAGEKVLVCPSLSCGWCDSCMLGDESSCRSFRILGYQTQGGYAEYVSVPARNLLRIPPRLSFVEAASFPLVLTTVYHQLVSRGQMRVGDRVLVMGGTSGIGTAAIQLCKASGAWVVATVGSPSKESDVKALGADMVVNHTDKEWPGAILRETNGAGVDLICEHFGGEFFLDSLKVLAPLGRLVTIGYTVGSSASIDLSTILRRQVTIATSYMGTRGELLSGLQLVERGLIRPVVGSVFPLDRAREAHELLESRKHFGKIVLTID